MLFSILFFTFEQKSMKCGIIYIEIDGYIDKVAWNIASCFLFLLKGESMFQIGDKVLDKNGKIFVIDHVEDKDFGVGVQPYFIMKPCFPYDFNAGYVSFVPTDKADNLLRPIMNEEEAMRLIDSFKEMEVYPEVNPRERKNFYSKIVANGNRDEICRVIKSLIVYRQERLNSGKPFSDFDRRLLESLTLLLKNELSISLHMPIADVFPFVYQRTGFSI